MQQTAKDRTVEAPAKPKRKAKGKKPRLTTREARAKALTLDNPQARARLDQAIKGIGECWANSAIITSIMQGNADLGVPSCSMSLAYDYLTRAQQELEAALAETRTATMAKTVARLETIQRKALAAGEFAAAMQAADRLAINQALPNPVTAARAIHLPNTPPPGRPAGSLTDAELEAVLARAKS